MTTKGEADAPAAALRGELITALLSKGLRLETQGVGVESRRGGAGPSDHKAVAIAGRTVMAPVHTGPSSDSPFAAVRMEAGGSAVLEQDGTPVAQLFFPPRPRFYDLSTEDGVPYWKIAALHGADVLATTVIQSCVRYKDPATACRFCAIGQSLADGRTIARKSPAQLAEVAKAAVELDGVKHMVMTTGTPNHTDRGAAALSACAAAIRRAVDLPLQGQCEPPEAFSWFQHMRDSGIDSLGMHIEAVTPEVRARMTPGKAKVSIERYLEAFEAAALVFGRGQVSTYILAGLGDGAEAILAMCERLIAMGVYPFVVPFTPITGAPLEKHPAPDPRFVRSILAPLGGMLAEADLYSSRMKAGCGRCGACSSLADFETRN
jgi:radical SAM protein (TIGR04043 family)